MRRPVLNLSLILAVLMVGKAVLPQAARHKGGDFGVVFHHENAQEVQRSLARLKRSFSSPAEFEDRRRQSGLSSEELQAMVKSQLYLSNYLDTRFRPSIQVEEKDVEEFYKERVVPRAEERSQTPPTLEAARDFIQEALVQWAINEQADRWLKESRARIRVENMLTESKP